MIFLVELIGLRNYVFDIDMLTDTFEVAQNLSILSTENFLLTGEDEGKWEEVDVDSAILVGEDGFPDAEGFEHLELLWEEQGDPAKAIVERIDLKYL